MTAASPLEFNLVAFFPADHAEAAKGKLYANGAFFSQLNLPTYPAVLPPLTLAAVMEVPFGLMHAEHQIQIGLADPDGRPLALKVQGRFRVGGAPTLEYGDSTIIPVTFPILGLVLERPGRYTFTCSIDDKELGRYSIRAIQTAVPLRFNIVPPQSEAG
jgi:hypothetical protein